MKLSFVIPAYNEEKVIGDCIESIERELIGKKFDVEIIVVDNNSSDKTAEIAKSFSGVKVVHEPIKGLSGARHAGYLNSSGDLIANIDANTKLTTNWIEKVFSEFSKNENLVALSGPHFYYDLSRVQRFGVKLFYLFGYINHIINHKIFKTGAMLQGGNFVVRRTALEEIGGYNVEFVFYGEDTDIARRIQKVGDVKWTFKFPIYKSGRRLKQEGFFTMGFRYALNHFWTIIFGKPFTRKFRDIK